MMLTFRYSDIRAYQAWTLEFLDCVFGKTDVEFYQYTSMDLRESCMPMPCDHSILTMLPLIIWNIPLWIYHEISGIMSAGTLIDMIWLKTGLALCSFLTGIEAIKIVRKINPHSDSVLALPLILLSGDLLISTMYCGQDEIIYILFLTMALHQLVCNNIKRFVLFCTISVTLNPLTLLPVLIMIAYRFKKILFVLLITVITIIPTFVFELMYKTNSIYQDAVVMNKGAMATLFSTGVTLGQDIGKVPLIIILFCIILFLSFITAYDDNNHYTFTILIAAMTMGQILLSTGSYLDYFYRSPLYIPFLVIMILSSKQDIRTNLILYGLYTTFQNWICIYNDNNLSNYNLQLSNHMTQKAYNNFGCLILNRYITDSVPILKNIGLITAVIIALAVVLFYVNKPNNKIIRLSELRSDKLLLILSLYMPVILVLFFGMLADYAYRTPYHKEIVFGSEYLEEPQGYTNISYNYNSGMHTYSSKIVYESGVCLIEGTDENGIRTINPDGISFGPYTTLYEGSYEIIINGENLEQIGLSCTSTMKDAPQSIDIINASLSYSQASYQIEINERTENVEFAVYNSTDNDVILNNIIIEEIK